jgi:hypothetical protein
MKCPNYINDYEICKGSLYDVDPFKEGDIDGEGEAACGKGVVERGREEFAGVGEREALGRACSETIASDARRRRTEGDETGDSVSVD